MGSGKTYCGQLLSQHLSYPFIDLDSYIVQQEHQSILDIFSTKGEVYFRKQEHKYLQEILNTGPAQFVLAVGGGTPCFYSNMELMNSNMLTVYLETGIETLYERLLLLKENRPLLKDLSNEDLKNYITELLEIREPFYSKAKIVIDEKEREEDVYSILLKKNADL